MRGSRTHQYGFLEPGDLVLYSGLHGDVKEANQSLQMREKQLCYAGITEVREDMDCPIEHREGGLLWVGEQLLEVGEQLLPASVQWRGTPGGQRALC